MLIFRKDLHITLVSVEGKNKAKKLEKFQTKNHKNLQMVEVNPYTEMHKLIEEIMK